MRQDDRRRVEILQLGLRLALQVAQHAARDVGEVGGALAKIIVVELAHLARVDAHHLLIGKIDIQSRLNTCSFTDSISELSSSERMCASKILASDSPIEDAIWLRWS